MKHPPQAERGYRLEAKQSYHSFFYSLFVCFTNTAMNSSQFLCIQALMQIAIIAEWLAIPTQISERKQMTCIGNQSCLK